MLDDDLKLVTRSVTEELVGADEERVKSLLESSKEARQILYDLREAADLMAGARFRPFAPGFADGVMARVAPSHAAGTTQWADSLVAVFYRVAAVGIVVAVALGTLNVVRASDLSASAFDAALAIPTVTFESAYEMEARALREYFVSAGDAFPITVPAPPQGGADSSSSEGAS